MKDRFCCLCASVLGVGFVPVIPGTMGTMSVLPFFFLYQKNVFLYFCFFIFIFAISIPVCHVVAQKLNKKDPQIIVIDEVLGFMLALFFAEPFWIDCLGIFVLFRFFDIVKMWPISVTEKYPGGFGIVCDDLLAGVFAGIVWSLFRKWILNVF